MRTISPDETKTLREVLLIPEAWTLPPGSPDPDKVNIMLDHLRGFVRELKGCPDSYYQIKPNHLKSSLLIENTPDGNGGVISCPAKYKNPKN